MRDDFHNKLNQSLFGFLDASPTPFHATEQIAIYLHDNGFLQLHEEDAWQLDAGGKYYVIRNESSIIAWVQGKQDFAEQGFRMLGAHTDSPCLRVRPNPVLEKDSVTRIAVDVYGGVLLNPWFDRDLSLAGRVHYSNGQQVHSTLIDCKCPIGFLPSLAIHLDREANTKRAVNAQLHTPVYLAASGGHDKDLDSSPGQKQKNPNAFESLLLSQLNSEDKSSIEILDYELSFYDVQRAAVVGVNGDMLASARLDNLLSCFIDLQALLHVAEDTTDANWSLLICSDHEEVGSQSNAGAAGPFLRQTLQRIIPDNEILSRGLHRSMLISTDNAHALHANYPEKMEPRHSPKLNHGPVIKVNANQRYASNSETQALFRSICKNSNIPVQEFVTRGDMGCGSTIGPITSAEIGVKTLDIGVPTLGMHSIRESAGFDDTMHLLRALQSFLQR